MSTVEFKYDIGDKVKTISGGNGIIVGINWNGQWAKYGISCFGTQPKWYPEHHIVERDKMPKESRDV